MPGEMQAKGRFYSAHEEVEQKATNEREKTERRIARNWANLRRKAGNTMSWVSVKDGMPDTEIECVVAAREHDLIYTHKIFAQWDGYRWVDAEGEEIKNVVSWVKAPVFNLKAEEAMKKLRGCLENDKCEEKDCCYFVTLDLLKALLEYIKE